MREKNKKLGNGFEAALCELLFEQGYWVHNLAQNAAGQPADVLAVKNGHAYLIDCKVCSTGKFPFSRMEENQNLAMTLWEQCGNGEGWFAMLVDEKIFMIPHSVVNYYKYRQSGFNAVEIRSIGIPLKRWYE